MRLFSIFLLLLISLVSNANADSKIAQKPKMKMLGVFDAGQPNVSIIKLLDTTDDVLCYVLMPDNVIRREVDRGKWTYESNSVGSISCLKVMVPVVPIK